MRKHPIRKFIGLTILYAVLLIGIFAVQFKTESVFTKTAGEFQVVLSQTQTENNGVELKNRFQVTFHDIVFYATEASPAILSNSAENGNTQELILQSFETDDSSVELIFTDGSLLRFSTPQSKSPILNIIALPASGESISFSYKIGSSYSIQEKESGNLILQAKDGSMLSFGSEAFDNGLLTVGGESLSATLSNYEPSKRFDIASAEKLPLANAQKLSANIQQLRNLVVTRYNNVRSSGRSDTLDEEQIISYVAEMGANNRYNMALDSVPESFARGRNRTYKSVNYFGSLANMNQSLNVHIETLASLVKSSVEGSLTGELFLAEDIAYYIILYKHTPVVAELLDKMVVLDTSSLTAEQVTGILSVYSILYNADKSLSAKLDFLIPKCIDIISDASSIEDNALVVLNKEGEPLDYLQTAKLGDALTHVGQIKSNSVYENAGYQLSNQALANLEGMDMLQLSRLYPIYVVDNTFYPHFLIFGYYGTEPAWAWTCANDIGYSFEADGTVDLNIEFTQSYTQHIIFKGIPTFHSRIEIQGMMFRSDPNFESYNSSGYVYQEANQTLFIKSRHRNRSELIRLFCDRVGNFVSAK